MKVSNETEFMCKKTLYNFTESNVYKTVNNDYLLNDNNEKVKISNFEYFDKIFIEIGKYPKLTK